MLGSAVSSSTPRDFQRNSHMGHLSSRPLMNCHAIAGVTAGCPYDAVGMHRALDSAMGLPSRSTSAFSMLGFLIPAEVRRSFTGLPESGCGCAAYSDSARGRKSSLDVDLEAVNDAAPLTELESAWELDVRGELVEHRVVREPSTVPLRP